MRTEIRFPLRDAVPGCTPAHHLSRRKPGVPDLRVIMRMPGRPDIEVRVLPTFASWNGCRAGPTSEGEVMRRRRHKTSP
jgi:hypothetical protein